MDCYIRGLAGAVPVFPSSKEEEEFRERFQEQVKPQLDAQVLARVKSEEASRKHFVY